MVWLLDNAYDTRHRAYMMREKEMKLEPLKIRYHGVSGPAMPYDERYTPYIQQAGLLPWIQLEGEEKKKKKKERKAAGAAFTWIHRNFANCPTDATDDVIQTHARVYMWYFVSRTLFPDSTGKNAPWIWLKALTVFDSRWSWGSVTLAYLYRQLDDACCRITGGTGIGGNMLLLSVWSWERLPIGRPKSVKFNPWDEDDELRLWRPTWSYKWEAVSEMTNDVNLMYQKYISELDTITPEQPHPPEWVDTDKALHSSLAFDNYLRWFLENARVEICPPAYNDDILEDPANFEDLSKHQYNKTVREGRHAKKLRRLSNLLGCRDPEYDEPSASRPGTPSDPLSHHQGDAVSSSFAYMDDEGAVTQEVDDDMTLADAQVWSAYMLKPRHPIKRYTSTDFDNIGNPKVVTGSSRMASLDDEAEEEEEEEEARPARRKKITNRDGTRNTRARH
ncbi:uncharacterized protein LOC125519566 [Triticum urartu]|uniref:uncharacterized protein LOC125519566 n=1 Tax=Triticum urartu TaxID=4572 RepID=UPI002044B82E|nr:uncharacterized protein LOC125519566 [Triticum urartu]